MLTHCNHNNNYNKLIIAMKIAFINESQKKSEFRQLVLFNTYKYNELLKPYLTINFKNRFVAHIKCTHQLQ